jgi:ABC-type bacteriocin/lantibiotic exporter with double-glycine peptidase domain
VRRNTVLVDAGIAVVLAAVVLIVSPGLAVVAILAIIVVVVCAISFAIQARPRRSRPPRSRKRSSGRPPSRRR